MYAISVYALQVRTFRTAKMDLQQPSVYAAIWRPVVTLGHSRKCAWEELCLEVLNIFQMRFLKALLVHAKVRQQCLFLHPGAVGPHVGCQQDAILNIMNEQTKWHNEQTKRQLCLGREIFGSKRGKNPPTLLQALCCIVVKNS